MDRPSSGAIARGTRASFDALSRHLLPQAGEGTSRLIALGMFGAPQGVRGEVRIKSYTRDPKAIAGYGPLTDGRGTRFAFEAVRLLKDEMLVVRVAGVGNREAAAALTGRELFARREQLPPPDTDEFYYDDLVGLTAVTRAAAPLGRVVAVNNYGAGDILEILPGAGGESLLLPFTKAVAVEIDFPGRRIVIEPPDEVEGQEGQGDADE
jgi:16S rRNA processing protein RimM